MIIQIPSIYIHNQSHKFRRSSEWDSIYCVDCLEWIEPQCKCGPEDMCPYNGDQRSEKPIFKETDIVAEY